jgi:hypothetical protein
MNADRPSNNDQPPPPPENCERRGIFSVLHGARELDEKGSLEIFRPDEAWFLTEEIFLPQARKWSKKAGDFDGEQWGRIEDSNLPEWMEDRRVVANVSICWVWFGESVGRKKENQRRPWETILARAECDSAKSPEEREEQVRRDLATGAHRALLHALCRGEPSGALKAGIAGALDELVTRHGFDESRDAKGSWCYAPAGSAWPPDPTLDPAENGEAFAMLADKIGTRSPSGGRHSTTHAIIPGKPKLVVFIIDACSAAERALSEEQLFHLAVAVFTLDLSPLLKVQLETETDEATGETIAGIRPDDEMADPTAESANLFGTKAREPFSVITERGEKVAVHLAALDGVPIDAAVNDPRRGKRGRNLGPAYFGYYLWRGWKLWNPCTRQPICGARGLPRIYGCQEATSILGKKHEAIAAMGRGLNVEVGKMTYQLAYLYENLSGNLLAAFEKTLADACAEADRKFNLAPHTVAERLESGRMRKNHFRFVLETLIKGVTDELREPVAELLIVARSLAEKQVSSKPGALTQALESVLGDLDEDARERVEDYLRCRFFHMKPNFVNPANFNPATVLKNLQ